MRFRTRTPDTPYKRLERLSRQAKAEAKRLGHDMKRFERELVYCGTHRERSEWWAMTFCRFCGADLRVTTYGDPSISGAALKIDCGSQLDAQIAAEIERQL